MNGRYFYFALTALLGVLCSLINFVPFFLLTLIYSYLLYRYKSYTKSQLVLISCLFFVFLAVSHHTAAKNKTIIPESTATFILEYNQDTKIDGDLFQVTATEINYKEKLLVRYKIKSEQEKEALKNKDFYGCQSRVTGELSKPAIAKNPNGFNYQSYLAAKQTYWIMEMEESPLQTCSQVKSSILAKVKQIRFLGIRYLENHFPPDIASLSAALIFGDRNVLNPDLLEDYQKTGIVHLLAISGLHVSLLVGMVYYLGIRIGFTKQFMMNFLLTILPFYIILTGGSPSVIRAVMMIYLVLLLVKWNNRIKLLPIDAISLALIIYLFFSPMIIFDIGFQLSFTVSFAIILSAPKILKRYQKNISRMLVTSITSQLAALPFLLYHYFELSFISLFANLLYIPLFSFVYLPGLYLLFFVQLIFGTSPTMVINLFIKIITFSNQLIAKLADYSLFRFTPGRPNGVFLVLYLLIILLIFFIWEARYCRKRNLHLFLLTCLLLTIQSGWNVINPYGEVTMIDVGQGDSILIHLPFGKGNYLIDTGGTLAFSGEQWKNRVKPYEVGRDVVVPFLKGKGITKIDKLILTHGDMDHIGGAFSILKELEVKQILMSSVVEPSEAELNIIKLAEKKGIPALKVSEGNEWTSGESFFYILSPEKNFSGERNKGSVTIFVKVGGLTWFFGGDLDQEGEEKIIKKYPNLKIDILKAGHHGSKTSSAQTFINQIKPRVSLISVGEKNRFGHPHKEVLDRLKKAGSIIYRTDKQGAITYRFFQGKGTFFTYLP
ncbi:DNA internalization-related competence protein ComEC/Rec2 [Neobacillus ginsengisoli]|uniref:Competence protein ComEC n=1 Tax=Neobacillus ginsengisoli TaxID=904295 RepID=A0ABT9XNY0_9BACI|nr:DNA internalization-related competence protein ComEC/Rec2 [Neobacillus ginsengisoli]MDQ0197229.1 competence protein ComEC [Neobacillus ginsengisoli]